MRIAVAFQLRHFCIQIFNRFCTIPVLSRPLLLRSVSFARSFFELFFFSFQISLCLCFTFSIRHYRIFFRYMCVGVGVLLSFLEDLYEN